MHIVGEAAIIFGLCFLSEGIAALLPIPFPASVISMLLLAVLLLAGFLKEHHIKNLSDFLIGNMAFFFLPTAVGVMEHFDLLRGNLLVILAILVFTVPIVYFVTAWTVQLLMLHRRKERQSHAE